MISLFNLQFFRNAFIVSIILSVIYGIFSFIIVTRKMSFLGVGISHTAFGGVAIGIILGLNPFYTALIFCIISALLMGKLAKAGKISLNTSIGIFFSWSMALGALLISLKKDYTFDLSGYLFGNILGVKNFDIFMSLILFLIFIPFVLIFMRRIIFTTFDEEVASISGVNVNFLDTMILILLSAIIVVSMKIIGIILVSALVVLPASFGLLLSKNYRKVIVYSIIYTFIITVVGLFSSYYLNTPAGATIVTMGALFYFIAVLIKQFVIKKLL